MTWAMGSVASAEWADTEALGVLAWSFGGIPAALL